MKASDAVGSEGGASAFGLISIDAAEELTNALSTMRQRKVHHLLVEKDGAVVGVVSDRGIIEKAFLFDVGKLDGSKLVGDVMLAEVPRVQIDDDLSHVVQSMHAVDASAAIVYQGEKLCGFITERDLLRQLSDVLTDTRDNEFTRLSKIFLSDPVVQRIMKAVSDVGI